MRAARLGEGDIQEVLQVLRERRAAGRRRRVRRRLAMLAALAVGNLAVVGTDVFLLSQRNVTRAVTLDSALQRFRTAAPVAPAGPATATATAGSDITSPVATGGTGPAPASSSVRSAATVATASSGGPVVVNRTTPVSTAFTLPAEGVYAYRTTGGEQIDILNASHSYPSVTYGTVLHQGGCVWQLENDVIQEHTDRRHFCSGPGQLFQLDQARYITFFGRKDGLDYTCRPRLLVTSVGEVAGITRDGVCSDSSGDAANIHETDFGPIMVTVGGVAVTAIHVVLDSALSGRAVGKAHDDLLVLASTGLTVSWHRSVDTVADAAFGAKAHYTEHATFDLISLDPKT